MYFCIWTVEGSSVEADLGEREMVHEEPGSTGSDETREQVSKTDR